LFARVQDRSVLVVGGGVVAERKVRALLGAGAKVHVGAPTLSTQLEAWVGESRVSWRAGTFELDWLDDVWLAIAATDDPNVNAAVKASAEERRIWTNVVDDPYLSSFQVPAVVDRAPVCIAVSSGGVAPMLARRIRERIETMVTYDTRLQVSFCDRSRQRTG